MSRTERAERNLHLFFSSLLVRFGRTHTDTRSIQHSTRTRTDTWKPKSQVVVHAMRRVSYAGPVCIITLNQIDTNHFVSDVRNNTSITRCSNPSSVLRREPYTGPDIIVLSMLHIYCVLCSLPLKIVFFSFRFCFRVCCVFQFSFRSE